MGVLTYAYFAFEDTESDSAKSSHKPSPESDFAEWWFYRVPQNQLVVGWR